MKSTLTEEPLDTRTMDAEEHWNELHQSRANGLSSSIRQAGRKLKAMHLTEVAGIAAAGFALGYLFFSSRSRYGHRGRRLRNLIEGSVIPAASKGLHRAYDSLRDGKPIELVGREVSKLRAHW